MNYSLENDTAKITIDTWACEISSFKRKDKSIEYMWQGDKKYWSNRNPILFPHVSSPKNKILNFNGKDYSIGNHGFLRRSEFTLVDRDEKSLTFKFEDDENTLKEYPYHFSITVKYTLNENRINVEYVIKNKNDIKMPFGFGLHPAFNCPLDNTKRFDDYKVVFEKDENEIKGNTLCLSRELFKKYPTYYIRELNSKSLVYTDGINSIKMNFEKFNMFGLWTCEDAEADYVCLEPWLNEIDKEDIKTPFEERQGVRFINPSQDFMIDYYFEIA